MPTCSGPCATCGVTIEVNDGVALLVADPGAVASAIASAAARLPGWYDDPQAALLTGPYRHHMAKRRAWLEATIAAIPASARHVVVDAGSGDGNNLPLLTSFGTEVYALDLHLDRLRRARRHGDVAGVAVADLTDWAVADESVDLLLCNHVLEHVPDDATAAAELARALRPGGTAIVGVPNEGAAAWRFAYAIEPWYRRRTDHVHFHTDDSISALLTGAGLDVVTVEHIGWGVPSFSADAAVRRFRWVDDGLERIGRRWFPRQATSLYAVARNRS